MIFLYSNAISVAVGLCVYVRSGELLLELGSKGGAAFGAPWMIFQHKLHNTTNVTEMQELRHSFFQVGTEG
jgi:hypothetical protein